MGERETSVLEEEDTEAPTDIESLLESLGSSANVPPEELRAIEQVFGIFKDQEGGVPADLRKISRAFLSSQAMTPERSRAIDQLFQFIQDGLCPPSKEKDRVRKDESEK